MGSETRTQVDVRGLALDYACLCIYKCHEGRIEPFSQKRKSSVNRDLLAIWD